MIDWVSDESHLLLNPRMPEDERQKLASFVTPLPAHVWVATSGTTGALKLTALSKQAILASAAAVNRRLQSNASDVWCCVLPTFHVGGLGIYARAHLSGARVIASQWNPQQFAAMREITLASLVPAQVRDLVAAQLRPPAQLRSILVGGGAFDVDLCHAARELGWPVLPSYGMTELCSTIAVANGDGGALFLLDHVEARTEEDGRLAFRSAALLTGYGSEAGFTDPKADGWLMTEDLGNIDGRQLSVTGRKGDFIKIGGESVDLSRLDAILASIAGLHAAVVAMPDERLGQVVHLAIDRSMDARAVASAYNSRVHPFERARRIHVVDEIPRSSLGKLLRKQLLDRLPKIVE